LICTYSDEENKIIIRDINTFEIVGSINNDTGVTTHRSNYNMVLNEIGCMALTKSNLLITGESKKVKIWDTRMCARQPVEEFKQSVEEFKQPAFNSMHLPDKWVGYKTVSNVLKFKYVEEYKILAAIFSGGSGIFTFDLRKREPLDYYKYHYYPVTAFDTGENYLSNIAISAGATQKLQYDLRISDIKVPYKDHDSDHYVMPGHKAMISK
jgi:WD40 repeat protein